MAQNIRMTDDTIFLSPCDGVRPTGGIISIFVFHIKLRGERELRNQLEGLTGR